MGRQIYFTDEESETMIDAVKDYAFIGYTSKRYTEMSEAAWELTRQRQQDRSDLREEERAAHDAAKLYRRKLEQRILSKLST